MLLLKAASVIKSERKGRGTLYYLVDVVPTMQYCCRAITTTKVSPCYHMIALELGKNANAWFTPRVKTLSHKSHMKMRLWGTNGELSVRVCLHLGSKSTWLCLEQYHELCTKH